MFNTNFTKIALLICLFVALISTTAQAKVDYQLDYTSRYIWRGFDLNANDHYAVQPSVNYEFPKSNWSVNLWTSLAMKDHKLNEVDLTFNYDFETTGPVNVSAGIVHYGWYWSKGYNTKLNTSVETYITLGWKKCDLNPQVSLYQDVKNGSGFYGELSLSKEVKVSSKNSMEVSASLGYNHNQWVDATGFSNCNLTLTFPTIKSGNINFTPFYTHTWVLMDEVNPGENHEDLFGLSVTF